MLRNIVMTLEHPRNSLGGLLVVATLFAGLATAAKAGPLESAQVNKIVKDVRIVQPQSVPRPAKVGDVVRDDVAVRTGTQSRAELLFQDQTLTRMGPDSLFSFKAGTREMKLDRGTMLLQVPKGLGGAQIQTAAVTAAITGTTVMLENAPGDYVKVVVLEGRLRLSMNKRFGGSVVLTPGKMVMLGAKDTRLPKPVSVDLKKMVETSALIDPRKFQGKSKTKVGPLPSVALIQHEVSVQSAAKAAARLVATGREIHGNGTEMVGKAGEKGTGRDRASSSVEPSSQGRNLQAKAAQRSDVAKANLAQQRNATGAGNENFGTAGMANNSYKSKQAKQARQSIEDAQTNHTNQAANATNGTGQGQGNSGKGSGKNK